MKKKSRQTLLKWVCLVALLVYVGWAAAWSMEKGASQLCEGIVVSVESNGPIAAGMSPSSVKSELGPLAKNYSRTPVSRINTDSLERRLAKVNNFEHVECYINSRGQLCLDVTPMVPVARIFTSSESYYINKDGKRIDARPEYYADVPVVYGNFTSSVPARMALPVVNYVASDSLLRSLVTMIVYKSPRNIMVVPRLKGHIVNIGDTTDLKDKFDNLLAVYRKVLPVKGWDYYDTISVKFAGQAVCTRRDKTLPDHGPGLEEYEDEAEVDIPLEDLAPASVSDPKPPAPRR